MRSMLPYGNTVFEGKTAPVDYTFWSWWRFFDWPNSFGGFQQAPLLQIRHTSHPNREVGTNQRQAAPWEQTTPRDRERPLKVVPVLEDPLYIDDFERPYVVWTLRPSGILELRVKSWNILKHHVKQAGNGGNKWGWLARPSRTWSKRGTHCRWNLSSK